MKLKLLLLSLLTLSFFTLCACTGPSSPPEETGDGSAQQPPTEVELIDDGNRDLIGKATQGTHEVPDPEEIEDPTEGEDPAEGVEPAPEEVVIPENEFFSEVVDGMTLSPHSIRGVVADSNVTPEIFVPNAAVGVFFQEDTFGWDCQAGDTLSWSYETYEDSAGTVLAIGYIKDDVMYEMETYDDLDGTFELTVPSDGVYLIYVMGASKDPVALKEGVITQTPAS